MKERTNSISFDGLLELDNIAIVGSLGRYEGNTFKVPTQISCSPAVNCEGHWGHVTEYLLTEVLKRCLHLQFQIWRTYYEYS